jgi:hypothetical protein
MSRTSSLGRRFFLIAGLLLLPLGCAPATSTVTGIVTLDGAPVPEGTVSFLMEDGTVHSAIILPNGAYQAELVPVGRAKVTIIPKTAEALSEEDIKNHKAPPKVEPPKFAIPSRYTSPDSSGLTCEVKGKETKYDIPLTR